MNTLAEISLEGDWHVSLGDASTQSLAPAERVGSVHLPGDLAAQGFGEEISVHTRWMAGINTEEWEKGERYQRWRIPGGIHHPFWLQPDRHYRGVAWYMREIDIPQEWSDAGRRVVLTLERPHWETRVFLDGHEIGRRDSLSTPHEYDLGTTLTAGLHTLAIRVSNELIVDIGIDAHSISDHTQGNWNGVIGRIGLYTTADTWLQDVQVYPRVMTRSVIVRGELGRVKQSRPIHVVQITLQDGTAIETRVGPDGLFEVECSLGADAELWDEFHPMLHRLTVSLPNGESKTVTFGLREVGVSGNRIQLNGRTIFLRGTLECAVWPRTGYPPVDVESWRAWLRVIKEHGLNHVRFHSWCPPEAAFVAADEMGVYLQVEAASWPSGRSSFYPARHTALGEGQDADAWIVRESDRILRAYGNHPSFLFMASGNEPGGSHRKPWLSYWMERMKSLDARRLYTCASGWPDTAASQFHVTHELRRNFELSLSDPPHTCIDHGKFVQAYSIPIVAHEIGQWCAYPNFDEIKKYTGLLKAKNYEIFRTTLAEAGMADQARDFLQASGKLQVLCYKGEMETALRTAGLAGFQMLGLSDFPGQGTSPVGVLDAFWENKGYITAEEFRRFSSPTVPLARLSRRVFEAGETVEAHIDLAHYGRDSLHNPRITWQWVTLPQWEILQQGELPSVYLPTGTVSAVGSIRIATDPRDRTARQVRLLVRCDTGAEVFENDWDLWIYPQAQPTLSSAPDVHFADALDASAQWVLEKGGTVLLCIPPDRVRGDPLLGKVGLGLQSIGWNTVWTQQWPPHTLGILCDPAHPALDTFPTEFHSNWQWWYVLQHSSVMILNSLPHELRPIIQVIDDWVTNRKLALLFEARVGRGRLLVSSIDLQVSNPVIRQLRQSLIDYASTPPVSEPSILSVKQIEDLFIPTESAEVAQK